MTTPMSAPTLDHEHNHAQQQCHNVARRFADRDAHNTFAKANDEPEGVHGRRSQAGSVVRDRMIAHGAMA